MAFDRILGNEIEAGGVQSAPDRLTGTAQENKRVFDNAIYSVVAPHLDKLMTALEGVGGAAELGAKDKDGNPIKIQSLLDAGVLTVADGRVKYIRFSEDNVLEVSEDGKAWKEASSSGPSYEVGHGLKLEDEKTLCVDAVSDFEGDNTLPITAAAVQETIGNIEIILATI